MLEATRNWPFMYDLLSAHVVRVELAHPKDLKAISSAAVKTDQIDAKVLAQLARLNYLPTAYAAPPETRDLRLYVRHREILVQERTQSKNRIHAVLVRYNLKPPVGNIFGKTGREWLQEMFAGEILSDAARRVMEDHLSLIDHLDMHIEALEKDITLSSEQKKAVKLLKTMPGVGKIVATTIIAEIGDIQRFQSPKALCNWAGLTPR
ncbi:MAG: IS110 family transposase, partial [Thermoleophilia bacterium]|nr:IS110 family transposase [Thermoleophilia bacterium]